VNALLERVFASVVAELQPEPLLAPWLAARRQQFGDRGRYLVFAYGKAARGLASAFARGLPQASLRGLVVPIAPDRAPLPPFEVIAGGHPLPTADSLRAGERAMALAHSVVPDETVIFLASGGGSAAFELPAVPDVAIADLQAFHAALVGSGESIVAINAVRTAASALKGGGLARAAQAAREQVTLSLCDVPLPYAAMVASAPSLGLPAPAPTAAAVLDRAGLWSAVPSALRERLGAVPTAEPLPLHSHFVLADNGTALRAAQRLLAAAGIAALIDTGSDESHYEHAAVALLHRLDRLRRRHAGRPVAIVAGGEVAVPLPPEPGVGGRNLQFALTAARHIRGRPIAVLSAGTDGIDGNSAAAGAIVDGNTATRVLRAGFAASQALHRGDAFRLLAAVGATLRTGPTGTNVRDLRVLLHRG
jgi:glycerate 2-kinase